MPCVLQGPDTVCRCSDDYYMIQRDKCKLFPRCDAGYEPRPGRKKMGKIFQSLLKEKYSCGRLIDWVFLKHIFWEILVFNPSDDSAIRTWIQRTKPLDRGTSQDKVYSSQQNRSLISLIIIISLNKKQVATKPQVSWALAQINFLGGLIKMHI